MEKSLENNTGMENQNNINGGSETNTGAESNKNEKNFNQDDVNKIIGDRLYKERTKWEKDFESRLKEAEKTAKMSAEEKAQHELEKREEELAKKEADLSKREIRTKMFTVLKEKELPDKLLDIIAGDEEETILKNIDEFEVIFTKFQTDFRTEFLKQNSYTPPSSTGNFNSDPFLKGLNKK